MGKYVKKYMYIDGVRYRRFTDPTTGEVELQEVLHHRKITNYKKAVSEYYRYRDLANKYLPKNMQYKETYTHDRLGERVNKDITILNKQIKRMKAIINTRNPNPISSTNNLYKNTINILNKEAQGKSLYGKLLKEVLSNMGETEFRNFYNSLGNQKGEVDKTSLFDTSTYYLPSNGIARQEMTSKSRQILNEYADYLRRKKKPSLTDSDMLNLLQEYGL